MIDIACARSYASWCAECDYADLVGQRAVRPHGEPTAALNLDIAITTILVARFRVTEGDTPFLDIVDDRTRHVARRISKAIRALRDDKIFV
jgi:hypothetical protein